MFVGLLAAVHLASVTIPKILELHRQGVDKEIIDEINDLMKKIHDVVDDHHTAHRSSE